MLNANKTFFEWSSDDKASYDIFGYGFSIFICI